MEAVTSADTTRHSCSLRRFGDHFDWKTLHPLWAALHLHPHHCRHCPPGGYWTDYFSDYFVGRFLKVVDFGLGHLPVEVVAAASYFHYYYYFV